MYVRKKGGYDAFPLMTEVTSIHAPKIMNKACRMNKVRESSDEKNRRFSSSALRGAAVNIVPGVHGAPVLQ